MHRRSLALLLTVACLACPAKAPTPEDLARESGNPAGVPVASEDDPRVVRDSDDLYAVGNEPNPPADDPAPGSGKPDTSNGVCKLFAPKLTTPECCPRETGFDADEVKAICGHALYMGESLQHSCGYFFLPDVSGGVPTSMRVSSLAKTEVAAAVEQHDLQLKRMSKNPEFESKPVPGLDGAMWSDFDGIHWAFLPGWEHVRQVSWEADACPMDKMPEVLKLIAEAKVPPPNAPRPGLIPVARTE